MVSVQDEPPLRLQVVEAAGQREFVVLRVHAHGSRGRTRRAANPRPRVMRSE